MKIAFDLDNTLFKYDNLWSKAARLEGIKEKVGTKDELKTLIENQYDWPKKWIDIQGRVYGEQVNDVIICDELIDFLEDLTQNGHSLYITSHKSKRSYCTRYRLQESAFKKIQESGLNKYFKEIYFFESKDEKVSFINKSNFDVLFDDLEDIGEKVKNTLFLLHKNRSKKFLSNSSWSKHAKIFRVLEELSIKSYKKVGKQSYHLSGRENYILKAYNDSKRCLTESDIFKHLYPEYIKFTDSHLLVTKYIESTNVEKIISSHKESFVEIFKNFQLVKTEIKATHFIDSIESMKANIQQRLDQLSLSSNEYSKLARIREYIFNILAKNIEFKTQLVNPDLFKGNIVSSKKGLLFLDFESFGLDDPARSLLNFIHHLGHRINEEEVIIIAQSLSQSYNDQGLTKRALQLFNYSALEWLLILAKYTTCQNGVQTNTLFNNHLNLMYDLTLKENSVISWKSDIYDLLTNKV